MTNQILIKLAMLDRGILPSKTSHDLIKMLESIPQEERRKFKRKFRKAWRKIAKKDPDLIVPMGLGSKNPTREQKMQRIARVYINAAKEK